MPIKVVECLDWSAPNRPGELLKVAAHLKKQGVNCDALWAYISHTGRGKIAAIGKSGGKLKAAVRKLGASPHATKCLYLSGKDKAGALVDTLKVLKDARINVECADAVAAQGRFGAAIWVDASDFGKAKRLLKAK